MERRQFTPEFKLEAVRLIRKRGVSYAQASADLGSCRSLGDRLSRILQRSGSPSAVMTKHTDWECQLNVCYFQKMSRRFTTMGRSALRNDRTFPGGPVLT